MYRYSLTGTAALTAVFALGITLLAGCEGQKSENQPENPAKRANKVEPQHITVDHILIGVRGAGVDSLLTVKEARDLAYDLLKKLEKNPSLWPSLKSRHSKDPGGKTYGMANHDVRPARGELPRRGMVSAFGDVGFKLEVGEIGMADYNRTTSPYGFHIIKRVR